MPELPEVELTVERLRAGIVGRTIVNVETDWPKYFKLPQSPAAFKKRVAGRRVIAVNRRGKNVLIHLSGDYLLLIHQKISGSLLIGNWERVQDAESGRLRWLPAPAAVGLPPTEGRFVHLLFDLDNGRQLGLSDPRKFGKALCAKTETILSLPELRNLGPDPLDPAFTFASFLDLVARRRGHVKQLLMNPRFIAGIGNLYSDEILYVAGIHPLTSLDRLREPQLKLLYDAIETVLRKALQMGGTGKKPSTPPGGEAGYDRVRMVYHRAVCPRGHTIARLRTGSRTAHFCPQEQRLF